MKSPRRQEDLTIGSASRVACLACWALAFNGLACSRGIDGPPRRTETNGAADRDSSAGPLAALGEWKDIAARSRVDFVYRNDEEAGHCSMVETLGGGVALWDYDGDGWLDIYSPGGGVFGAVPQIRGRAGRLWRNRGDGRFDDVTNDAVASADRYYTHGAAVGDFDDDGFSDLLVTGYGGLQLLHNQGDGTFRERTVEVGLIDSRWSSSAAWGDVNGDGIVDLYVAHYLDWSFTHHPYCPGASAPDRRDSCNPKDFESLPDTLFLGQGDGTFRDGTMELGLRGDGKGLGVVMADVDLDGDLDVYVANDTTANFLYRQESDGRWSEVGLIAGCGLDESGAPDGSMGTDIGDFDGDGWPDIWVVNFERESCALYRNSGDGAFLHASQSAGISAVAGIYVGWGTVFGDFDLDGDLDLFVSNGHPNQYPLSGARRQRPLLLSQENGRYREAAAHRGSYLNSAHNGRGAATGDFDNDGDLDLVISHVNEPIALLENPAACGPHWLRMRLVATTGPRDAVGAYVRATVNGKTRLLLVKSGGSYLSSGDARLTLGLGNAARVERLEIHWPGGRVQTLTDVAADRQLSIVEEMPDR